MLRVLQHYLPVRTFLLVASEVLLLTAVLGLGATQHLWALVGDVGDVGLRARPVLQRITLDGLTPRDAVLVAGVTAVVLALVAQACMGFNRLYEFQVSASRYERASRFVESAGAALAVTVVAVLATHTWRFERFLQLPGLTLSQKVQTVGASMVAAFAALYVFRIAFHRVMRRADLNQRVLILGSRGPAFALANQVLEHPEAGYEVVGLVPEPPDGDDRRRRVDAPALVASTDEVETEATRRLVLDEVALLERTVHNRGAAMEGASPKPLAQGEETLTELVRKLEVDTIVVALEDRRMTLPIKELLNAKLGGVDVREREEVYEQVTGRIAVGAMRPSYLVFGEGFRRHPWAALLKRTVDVLVSLAMLAVLWPVMLLTALLVKLDSPGPVLFTQERVGQDGKPFVLMKFRSMRADAEKLSGPVWASEDDPRITRFGRFMRCTRLDELPQLVNVLAGSMSLVGPRPERQHFVAELAEQIPYFQLRHLVKPGVTGWAQINYPYGNTVEDALHKLQYDLFYIKNHSVLFDLSILVSTIKTVVLGKGT